MFSVSLPHLDFAVLAGLATLALSFALSLWKLASGFIRSRSGS